MDRRRFIILTAGAPSVLGAKLQRTGLNLEVRVNYTGSGIVNATHQIYVLVWNTPAFIDPKSTVSPVVKKAVPSKTAFASFIDLQTTPVYVSVAYDPQGKWDASKPPPRGSSLGLYFKQPGTPAPIQLQLGTTVSVTVTLDDSTKMK